ITFRGSKGQIWRGDELMEKVMKPLEELDEVAFRGFGSTVEKYTLLMAVVNFPRGINTVIWAGNVINHAPVWCDIEIGTHYALASSTVCVSRNLAQISSPYYTTPSVAQRRTQLTFEIFMCAGWPAIGMILHIIVQAYRFLIIEDFGCKRSIYGSLPSVFLVSLPPIICSLVTLVYSGMSISLIWLIRRRARFCAALPHHPSGLTNACHLRLIALSITMMISIPSMTVFVFIINLTNSGLRPWVSWDYVHEDWQRIAYYEKKFVLQADWNRYLITWYMIPFISVIFFAFFGLGWETKEEYTTYACSVKTGIFRIKHKGRSVLPVSSGRTLIPERAVAMPTTQQ
ncbi:unnamed protein product, partial [Rhizoctonia solani]